MISTPEAFARYFLVWQKMNDRHVTLSAVKSFVSYTFPRNSNEGNLAWSRATYKECCLLLEDNWLATDEAKAIEQQTRDSTV